MRVVLASMNEIGKASLEALVKCVDLVGLFTPERRGTLYMDPTDFTELARRNHVPIYRVSDINSREAEEQIRSLNPDLGMSLGWKQIIKPHVLRIPRLGWIGGHPGKLLLNGEKIDPEVFSAPGNEPMNYAILGGFKRSGMTLMWLKSRVDAGEIFARGEVTIDTEHETSRSLLGKIAALTGRLLDETMPLMLAGRPPRFAQEMEHTQPFTPPLTAEGNRIDLSAPIEQTYRLIRACVYPYPNAFIDFYGQRLYIEHARVERGAFTELRIRNGGSPYACDQAAAPPLSVQPHRIEDTRFAGSKQ